MNYLAHLLLSGPHSNLALGNFLADMISPPQSESLPPSILAGVQLHRKIDMFTDSHDAVRSSTARIRSNQRKYAPVSVDIYYDFLLVRSWDKYSRVTLDEMADYIYSHLDEHLEVVPEPLQQRVRSMVEHQWLSTYRTADGIGDVFRRMAHRASRPEIMHSALAHLLEHDEDLLVDFNTFFPDMIDRVLEIHPFGNEWLILQNERKV